MYAFWLVIFFFKYRYIQYTQIIHSFVNVPSSGMVLTHLWVKPTFQILLHETSWTGHVSSVNCSLIQYSVNNEALSALTEFSMSHKLMLNSVCFDFKVDKYVVFWTHSCPSTSSKLDLFVTVLRPGSIEVTSSVKSSHQCYILFSVISVVCLLVSCPVGHMLIMCCCVLSGDRWDIPRAALCELHSSPPASSWGSAGVEGYILHGHGVFWWEDCPHPEEEAAGGRPVWPPHWICTR